ncbi:hypothetical protein N9L06_01565 [Mariniblastus sp.]|nr:hypothetical protein [Mariniblastus sp.]
MNTERTAGAEDRLEKAIDAISRMRLPESPDASEMLSLLPDDAIPRATHSTRGIAKSQKLYVIDMTFVKFASAAALVLIAALFMLNSPPRSAIAQVIANVKSHRLVRCQLETLARVKFKWRSDTEAEYVDTDSNETVYFDLVSSRFRVERVEQTCNDTVDSQWIRIQDNVANRVLLTSSIELTVTEKDTNDPHKLKGIALFRESKLEGKVAKILNVKDSDVKPFLDANSDWTLLEILDQLQVQLDIDAVADEVDGQPADKFVFKDGDQTITLWVHLQSRLPLRIEELRLHPYENAKWKKWTYTDFQWDDDNVVPDQLFSTEPPVGYVVEDHTDAP